MHFSLFTTCEYFRLSWRFTTYIQFPWLFKAALGVMYCVSVGQSGIVSGFDCLLLRSLLDLLYFNNGFSYSVRGGALLLLTYLNEHINTNSDALIISDSILSLCYHSKHRIHSTVITKLIINSTNSIRLILPSSPSRLPKNSILQTTTCSPTTFDPVQKTCKRDDPTWLAVP